MVTKAYIEPDLCFWGYHERADSSRRIPRHSLNIFGRKHPGLYSELFLKLVIVDSTFPSSHYKDCPSIFSIKGQRLRNLVRICPKRLCSKINRSSGFLKFIKSVQEALFFQIDPYFINVHISHRKS